MPSPKGKASANRHVTDSADYSVDWRNRLPLAGKASENGLSQRFTGAQLSTAILSWKVADPRIPGPRTGVNMPLAGHWPRLQGSRGTVFRFLYGWRRFERPTRRL